jgi:hypothetical protein
MSTPATILVKPTIDELRESKTVLSAGHFAFFVQAWHVDATNPVSIHITGSLFFYPTIHEALQLHGSPQCILGTDPERPARGQVILVSCPPGPVQDWTATDLALQDLYVTFPSSIPWLAEPHTYHLRNGRELPKPPLLPTKAPTDANSPLRP